MFIQNNDSHHAQVIKSDSPGKVGQQQHKSILKTDAVSPATASEMKRVHFMVNEEAAAAAAAAAAGVASLANAAETSDSQPAEAAAVAPSDDQPDSEDKNMEQLMAAAETAGDAVVTPDKDSSTITIFNESSEVNA